MKRLVITVVLLLVFGPVLETQALARGRGGANGKGAHSSGGFSGRGSSTRGKTSNRGGSRGPTMSKSKKPSGARPSSRPNSRPSTKPSSRPNTRPSTKPKNRPTNPSSNRPSSRPSNRPNTGGRPGGNVNFPTRPSQRPTTRPSNRPSIVYPGGGSRPSPGGGNRPNRPDNRPPRPGGGGTRPNRPDSGGNRPNRPDNRPPRPGGGGTRPNRPDSGGNRPNRPDNRPPRPGGGGTRPNRPDSGGNRPNRPDNRPPRPGGGGYRPGNRPDYRPGYRPGGNNNFININANNWGNRPWWHQPKHDNWHHGHWHGHNHSHWNNHYNYVNWGGVSPVVWGLSAWGMGNLIYNTGYRTYANPYYTEPVNVGGGTVIDYSQPITVYSNPTTVVEGGTSKADPTGAAPLPEVDSAAYQEREEQSISDFDQARTAFYDGNNAQALDAVEKAIGATPGDAALHEFRALVLFAEGRYHEAAAAVHSVLSVGPGWDWTTLSGLYKDTDDYSKQLQDLEAYVQKHPDAADAHFLLAYQYLTCGHTEAAADELKRVVKLQPTDQLAGELLELITPADDTAESQAELVDSSSGKQIAKQAIVGSWTSDRGEDGNIQLKLQQDGEFTWKYSHGKDENEFGGTYTLAGDVLVLASANGTQMVGNVETPSKREMKFRILGSPPTDPGLTFDKG